MNIEIIRNTLYKSYLESFYNFCKVNWRRNVKFYLSTSFNELYCPEMHFVKLIVIVRVMPWPKEWTNSGLKSTKFKYTFLEEV